MDFTENYCTIKPYFSWLKLQKIPEHKLYYTEWGDKSNSNIVLCVHGLTRNSHDFDRLAGFLSKDFRVIAVDVVGRGKSDRFENSYHYNYNTYIKDITYFIQNLSLAPVNFVGSSMGGIIGAAIASKRPELINSLLLNDIGPFIPKDALNKIAKYVSLQPVFETFEDAKSHLKMILSPFGIKLEEDWDLVTNYGTMTIDGKYMLNYDPKIITGMKIRPQKMKDVNFDRVWNKIDCPIMVIRGEKSEILLKETLDYMLNSKKNIKSYTASGVGHTPSLMDLEQIEAVSSWLNYVK